MERLQPEVAEPGGSGPPSLFFRGGPGGPNLRVYFYNIASA